MLLRLHRHATAGLCGAVLVFSCATWPTRAQSVAPAGKRPLSYNEYDAWWSIQGTTLARDGQWVAYALTSHGLDGQIVVRNLQTGLGRPKPEWMEKGSLTRSGAVGTCPICSSQERRRAHQICRASK